MRGGPLAVLLTTMMLFAMFSGCLAEDNPDPTEPEAILGCTHVGALNYNASATEDDGSCEFEQEEAPIEGCMDPGAVNFDLDAVVDDGSCVYEEPPTLGCTDPQATNFDAQANMDDGSCEYPPDPIVGCTDSLAENFDATATLDDGSCTYAPPPLDLQELIQEMAVGEQQVLVIAVHYPGENLTETIPEIQAAIESVGQWFSNASYGKVWFNITMAGPYQIADISSSSNEVYAAVMDDGYDVTAYNRIILGGHSATSSSSWSTLGIDSLNVTDNQGGAHEIIASRLQVNSQFYNQAGEVYTVIHHEMGHSFGLGHAGFKSTRTGQLFTYGTWNSVMGLPANLPFFSMSDAHQLGWVGEENVTTVTNTGISSSHQFTLNTIEEADAQGIRIPIPFADSDERYYWLTPRSQGNFSTAELTENFPAGELHPASGGGLGTLAIDTTPETHMWKGEMDTDLLPGRSWSDVTGTIHIRMLESSNDSVTVSVSFTSPQGQQDLPPTIDEVTATLLSTYPFVYEFNVNATDPYNDELTYFWNFGAKADGKFSLTNHADGQSQIHAYAQQNARRVWVTVSDGNGGVDLGWVDLENHTNQAPTVSEFILSTDGGGVVFNSNASDPNQDPMTYIWDFGDGNVSHSKNGYHQYDEHGYYNVTLTINDGQFSATYSEIVHSRWPGYPPNVPPIAEAGANQTVNAGSDFTLNGSGSYDADASPNGLRYVWSCAGCNVSFDERLMTTTVSGLGAGTWEFTLEVFDGWDRAYDTVWITVV